MNRTQGVVTPQGQLRDTTKGEPGKLYNAVPARLVAVQYADEMGSIIKEFWYEVGGQYYQPPEAERFASQLRPVREGFVKQARTLMAQHDESSVGISTEDDVDVVSQETAEALESRQG